MRERNSEEAPISQADQLALELVDREQKEINLGLVINDKTEMKQRLNAKDLDCQQVRLVADIIGNSDNVRDLHLRLKPEQLWAKLEILDKQQPCKYNFKFISAAHRVFKAMISGDVRVQRIVYDAFGVSLLDDLEVFSNLSPNYCLVNMTSLYDKHSSMHSHLLQMHSQTLSLL